MLTKRIIPCLDVKNGQVVKGIQFRQHVVMGDIVEFAIRYRNEGADELVFYDITASSEERVVEKCWIEKVAKVIDIPFCVAGGITNIEQARTVLNYGADKVSINTPALENPELITDLAKVFGSQCIVIGVDSRYENNDYFVYKFTGNEEKTAFTHQKTFDWIREAQERGAGEIVLNCMNQDGMREGYDVKQLQKMRHVLTIPLIASGGAGNKNHFKEVFKQTNVDGALAATVFHKQIISIQELKTYLKKEKIEVRI